MTPRTAIIALTLLFACPAWSSAADKTGKTDKAEPKNAPVAAGTDAAGKADAKLVFAQQAKTATPPAGDRPGFLGAYVWGSRADISYRPFFQWEFRIQAGNDPIKAGKVRLTTLGPDKKPVVQGEWKTLFNVVSGGTNEFSYRLNCTNPMAYQVEITTEDGSETYLACDKGAVPVPLTELADQGYVVAVNSNFESDEKTKQTVVTYTAWNVGGKPAKGVVQILRLRDEAGKEVATYKNRPEKGADLPPGYVKDIKVALAKVPKFATLSISTEQADTQALAEQGFTGAKDVEVAKVRAEGKELKARVRNGTGQDQEGVIVQIAVQDKSGKTLKTFDIPIGRLGIGEERDIAAELGGASAWAGYETSWKSSSPTVAATPVATKAAPAAGAQTGLPKPIAAQGMTLTPETMETTVTGFVLAGTVSNATGKDLPLVRVQVKVSDPSGRTQELECSVAALANGASAPVRMACGMKDIARMAMTWRLAPPEAD
ncbi:MAG: hypothetical protein H0V44_02775 [Planctomycetes bacterium]|nr:hypothetical protein [Planctomycetota bacterium]